MRTAMRALAINKRSIDAIRRAKRLLDGTKVAEAVLGILVPFWRAAKRCAII